MAFPGIIAFINPRSGGGYGSKLYVKLCVILGKDHVFDITQGGPEPGLRKFRKHVGLRVIACGGDGTVGWVHSCIDRIRFLEPPMVVPFPLGTGNDMSRVLGWGANYAGEAVIPLLESIVAGAPVKMDRWTVSSEPLESEDFELLHDKLVELKIELAAEGSEDLESASNEDLLLTQSEEETRRRSSSRDGKECVSPLSASAPIPNTTSATPPPSWVASRRIRFHECVEHLPVSPEFEEEDLPVIGVEPDAETKKDGINHSITPQLLTPPAKRLRRSTAASSMSDVTMSTQSPTSTSSSPPFSSSSEEADLPAAEALSVTTDAAPEKLKTRRKKKRSKTTTSNIEVLETADNSATAPDDMQVKDTTVASQADAGKLFESEKEEISSDLEQKDKGKQRKKPKQKRVLDPQPNAVTKDQESQRDELYKVREKLGKRLAMSEVLPRIIPDDDEANFSPFSPQHRSGESSTPSSEAKEKSRVADSDGSSAPSTAGSSATSPARTPCRYATSPAATRASLSNRDKLSSTYKKSAEAKTLVMNNYFSMGVDSMVALEFHYQREATPSLFPHHLINKAWYGIYGLKHAMMNLSKKPELKKVMRLELDGVEIAIPKGIEALVFLQIPSYSSGTNVWGDSSKCKGQKSPPSVCDGLFEVVGLKGVLHLGALQAGWSSGIRLGQSKRAVIHTLAVLPAQCDGEPWLLPPSRTVVEFKNQSTMLFNITKSKPKLYRSVTGHAPPSMVHPENQERDQTPDQSSENSAASQEAPPTVISAQELRAHIRWRSGSTGLLKRHEDVPAKVRSSHKMIVPQRTVNTEVSSADSTAE